MGFLLENTEQLLFQCPVWVFHPYLTWQEYSISRLSDLGVVPINCLLSRSANTEKLLAPSIQMLVALLLRQV
jgi:hypothetical protein